MPKTVYNVAQELIDEEMAEAMSRPDWDECIDGIEGYPSELINDAINELLDALTYMVAQKREGRHQR